MAVVLTAIVTPGNRGAAVIAGLNVIIFTVIALLAHREKKQKKRQGQLTPSSDLSDSEARAVDVDEKLGVKVDENPAPVLKH